MNVFKNSLDFSQPEPQDAKVGNTISRGQKRSGTSLFVIMAGGATLLIATGAILPPIQKQVTAWRLSKERDGFNGISSLDREWEVINDNYSSLKYHIRNDSQDTYQVVSIECEVISPKSLPTERIDVTDFEPGEVREVEFILKSVGDGIGYGTKIQADGKTVRTRTVAKSWLPWFLR
jgi:hypothetical protein